jgi:hypothetical protein
MTPSAIGATTKVDHDAALTGALDYVVRPLGDSEVRLVLNRGVAVLAQVLLKHQIARGLLSHAVDRIPFARRAMGVRARSRRGPAGSHRASDSAEFLRRPRAATFIAALGLLVAVAALPSV